MEEAPRREFPGVHFCEKIIGSINANEATRKGNDGESLASQQAAGGCKSIGQAEVVTGRTGATSKNDDRDRSGPDKESKSLGRYRLHTEYVRVEVDVPWTSGRVMLWRKPSRDVPLQ